MTATMNFMDLTSNNYSVLMSVYGKEQAGWFQKAAESMMSQTVMPSEFVLVCDGPLTKELDAVIDYLDVRYQGILKVLRLKENKGLGEALRQGVLLCSHELVARMDSDDIACPKRCEKQLQLFQEHKTLAFCSGTIAEFSDERELYTSAKTGMRKRQLPCSHREIEAFAKKRNPMNHMAVMFRKSAVLKSGNYRSIEGVEDYDLWARMLMQGFQAANLPDVLVWARIGNGMALRRGGLRYTVRILRFQTELLKMGFLNPFQYMFNCCVRVPVCLMPGRFRTAFYQICLRRQKQERTRGERIVK